MQSFFNVRKTQLCYAKNLLIFVNILVIPILCLFFVLNNSYEFDLDLKSNGENYFLDLL